MGDYDYKPYNFVDKDSCTTLKDWLNYKHDMSYEEYRHKSKSRRANLKYEYYKDTGLLITSDGDHFYPSSSMSSSTRSSTNSNYCAYGGYYKLYKIGRLHLIFGILFFIASGICICNFLPWYWWIVFFLLVIESCIACGFGEAFSINIRRGITKSILAIDTGISMELINVFVCRYFDTSNFVLVGISIGIFVLNYLISFLIARYTFLKMIIY